MSAFGAYLGNLSEAAFQAASYSHQINAVNVAAGDYVFVLVDTGFGADTAPSVTDSAGNTYALDLPSVAALNGRGYLFRGRAVSAITGGWVKVTYANSTTNRIVMAWTATGIAAATPLDVTNVWHSPAFGTTAASASVTPAANSINFALCLVDSTVSAVAATGPYTLIAAVPASFGTLMAAYYVDTAGTPTSGTFTWTTAASPDTGSAAYKTASGGTGPANTVLPAISGTPRKGQTLTYTAGTWTGSPAPSVTRQWRRNGVDIGGATATTYVLIAADVGTTITCRETATNATATVTADSNAIGLIGDDITSTSTGGFEICANATVSISISLNDAATITGVAVISAVETRLRDDAGTIIGISVITVLESATINDAFTVIGQAFIGALELGPIGIGQYSFRRFTYRGGSIFKNS